MGRVERKSWLVGYVSFSFHCILLLTDCMVKEM